MGSEMKRMCNWRQTVQAVLVGILAAWGTAPAQADLADTVSSVEPSVVTVVASRDVGDGRTQHVFGSGFFLTPTDIVTTARVLNDATSVRVVTYLDERLSASVVGVDLASRLAVLRIAEPIGAPADLAPGPEVRKGEAVFTLGSHLGMGLTVTGGMVNGVGRTVTTSGLPAVNDAFQIDAPVSADASGAPVFDDQGRVRGIVLLSLIPDRGTVYRPPGEGEAEGLGQGLVPGGLSRESTGPESTSPDSALAAVVTFCLPADTVDYVASQLRETGRVRRGVLGVEMGPIPAAIAAHLGLDPRAGAMVISTTEGGPAQRGGLRLFDIIVALDDVPGSGVRQIVKTLQTRPGEVVSLSVLRGSETVSLAVEIGEMVFDSPTRELVSGEGDPIGWLGVRCEAVDPAMAAHTSVIVGEGATVAYVFPGSPAEEAGIVPGDIIVEIEATSAPAALEMGVEERFQHQVRSGGPGSSLRVRVVRIGAKEPLQIDVRVGAAPDAQRLALSASAYAGTGTSF